MPHPTSEQMDPKSLLITLGVALCVFAAILAVLVVVRAKWSRRLNIKNSDVVVALVPVVLWLFLTHQLKEVKIGELTFSTVFKEATEAPVEKQVSKVLVLPVEAVQIFEKGGSDQIPRAIKNKSQALSFQLGRRGYYAGPAILQYLDQLTLYPYLRYIILVNPDRTFFGLADARQLAEIFRRAELTRGQRTMDGRAEAFLTAEQMADWLGANNTEGLRTLPGFIGTADALDSKADRQQALRVLNKLDIQTIPVIDQDGRFVGIVDRSKLTASILTDVAAKVEHWE